MPHGNLNRGDIIQDGGLKSARNVTGTVITGEAGSIEKNWSKENGSICGAIEMPNQVQGQLSLSVSKKKKKQISDVTQLVRVRDKIQGALPIFTSEPAYYERTAETGREKKISLDG